MFALRRLSQRVDMCAAGNGVRPLAEASLPLPPERRDSDGNAGATVWYDRAVAARERL